MNSRKMVKRYSKEELLKVVKYKKLWLPTFFQGMVYKISNMQFCFKQQILIPWKQVYVLHWTQDSFVYKKKKNMQLKLTGIQYISITRNTSRQTYERKKEKTILIWCVWGGVKTNFLVQNASGKSINILCVFIFLSIIFIFLAYDVSEIYPLNFI